MPLPRIRFERRPGLRQLSQRNALISKEENAKLARDIVDLTCSAGEEIHHG
jgi:hypothetical protein